MTDNSPEPDRERELRHELANSEQEKAALQRLAAKAAKEIDSLIEADCSEKASHDAKKLGERLRRAGDA